MKKLKKMIKSAILFAATGLAFGLTSCTNDNLESTSTNGSADKLYIIYGGFAQNENSRMSLNTVANQYDWQVGDGVCLYKEDGSLLTYHAITSSEITENGKIKLELRLPAEPKYITMAGKNGTYTTDGAYVDVNASVIDLYARTPSGILSPDAPILSQAKITDTLVNGSHLQIFAMQHKLAYVYIKEIKIDGTALNNIYVTATSGTMKITDVTNQDSETSLSNVAEIKSSIMTGYVIAVIPGTTLSISKDATSAPFVNAKLEPGYYIVERDIHTEYTMTYTSDNTAQGTVSSATESAIKGGATSAVTATANTGYTFEGWYSGTTKLSASGTDANGNAYTVSGAVLTITNAQSSASYVAKFSQNAYTTNFVSNNTAYGTLKQPIQYTTSDASFSTTSITNGWSVKGFTAITYINVNPASGYEVASWTKPDGTVIKVTGNRIDGSDYVIGIDGTLVCQISAYNGGTWTANFVKKAFITKFVSDNTAYGTLKQPIQYTTSDASFSTTSITNGWSAEGVTAIAEIHVNPASGYEVASWTKPDGTVINVTGDRIDCPDYVIGIEGTLFCQISAYDGGTWTANFVKKAAPTYEVEWVNGYGGTIRTDTKTWGTNLTSPAAPTRSLYLFKGWAISPSTTVTVAANTACSDYSFGKSSYSNAKVTMTAMWDAVCGITTETRTNENGLGIHFTGYFPQSGYIVLSKGNTRIGGGELRFYPRGNSSYVELSYKLDSESTTYKYKYPTSEEAKDFFKNDITQTSLECYSYTYDAASGFYDVYVAELTGAMGTNTCKSDQLLCSNYAYFSAFQKHCTFTCNGYSVKDSSCN